jgi:hypothetical protein
LPFKRNLQRYTAGVMSEHLRGYHAAAAAVLSSLRGRGATAAPGEQSSSSSSAAAAAAAAAGEADDVDDGRRWEDLRREVARLMWYVWSTAPYGRGAPTVGLMLHHAMYMAGLYKLTPSLKAAGFNPCT